MQSCPIASEIGVNKLMEECQRLGLQEVLGILKPISETIEHIDT